MNKKILGLALTSVFAVTALASCNKDDGKIHIKFWYSFGKSAEEPLLDQIKKFEEIYPEYKVDVVSKGGYDNLKKAISLEVSTGNFPDVTLGYPDHVAEYLSADIVVPLDDYMNSEDPEIGIGEGAHNAKNDFLPNYMEENRQYDEKGTTYGLPFNKSTELMYYNKTVFDHYNVKVPTTWKEFEETGNKLQSLVEADIKAGKVVKTADGKTLDWSALKDQKATPVRSYTYDSSANALITLIRDFGGTYTKVGDSIEKGTIEFDSAETREALNMLVRMRDNRSFSIPNFWESKYASDLFVKLQTFLTVGSSAGAKHNLPKDGAFEVGVAPIPFNDSLENNAGKNVIQQGTNLMMLDAHDDVEIKTGAWKLIRFLTAYQDEETGYDPNVQFAIGASYLPVRQSGLDSEAYKTFMNDTAGTDQDKIVRASAKKAMEYDSTWNKFTDPAFVGSSVVRTKAGEVIPAVIVAEKSVDEAIKACYDSLPAYHNKK